MTKTDHMMLHLLQLNVALLGKVWKLEQHMWKDFKAKCKTQYEGILGEALHMYQTKKRAHWWHDERLESVCRGHL